MWRRKLLKAVIILLFCILVMLYILPIYAK